MEIELNNKKPKRHGNRFFFFILTILCVVVCVFVSQFLSSVITTGAIGITNNSNSTSYSEYKLYALSLASYATETQAKDYASTVTRQGAGGYVWQQDSKFYVIASIYEKKNDAESVLKNLTENANAEIIEIKIDKVSLSQVSSTNLKKEYLSILSDLKETYCKLYDISVSLDTSVYSETKSRIEIDNVKTNLQSQLDKISNGSSSADGIYYVIIKSSVQKIIDKIGEVVEYTSTDNFPFSAKIKNTYISIVEDISNLIDQLNDEK